MIRDAFTRNTLASLTLRLALAAVFIYHGTEKITGRSHDWGASWATEHWLHAKIPTEVTDRLERLEKQQKVAEIKEKIQEVRTNLESVYRKDAEVMPAALEYHAAQLAVAWGELIGGLLMLVGFGSRLAAVWLIVIQIGAIFTVTWAHGFSVQEGGGYEYNLVLLASCLALFFLGSGPFSLSGVFKARRKVAQPAAPPAQVPVSV